MVNPEAEEGIIIAYVPAIHKGYLDLINENERRYPHLGILDDEVLDELDHLRKDVRALSPKEAVEIIGNRLRPERVRLIGKLALQEIVEAGQPVLAPDDDVTKHLLNSGQLVEEQTKRYPIFLRWHRENAKTNTEITPDEIVHVSELSDEIPGLLRSEAKESTGWWRRVGAVIAKEGKIIESAHNEHLPTQFSAVIDGDIRAQLRRGDGIEFTTELHAERSAIAKCAKTGKAIESTDIFVTDFPCPPCAKSIIACGIEKVYFVNGYAVDEGEKQLRAAGVKLIQIEGLPDEDYSTQEWREYPEKN